MKNFTLKSLITLLVIAAMSHFAYSQMPAAITIDPPTATAYDDLTLTFNPVQACFQSGSLAGVALVYMHSGVTIGGSTWQHVVEYNSTGANGQAPHLTPNPDGTYSIVYNPAAFYGLDPGQVVTHICAVFNDGQWNSKDGRDFEPGTTNCMDFFIPLAYVSTDPKFSFKVNMNKAIQDGIFDPITDDVFVTLDHGIAPLMLDPHPDFTYTGLIETGLDSGEVYNFKFRINYTTYEDVNRQATAVPGTTVIDVWWNDDPINAVTFQVDMRYYARMGQFIPDTDFMDMAGSMNGWAGSPPMTQVGNDTVYEIDYSLNGGDIYEYKFRINGDWATSEFPGGGPNRMMLGPSSSKTLYHMYNDYDPTTVPVTFNCIMKYQISAGHFDPDVDYLDVAGNFNGWGAYDVLFDRANDSVYTIKKNIPRTYIGGSPAEFKFRFNGDWATSEFPNGGPNRKYDVLDTASGVVNNITVWYDDKNPNIPTPPWAYDLSITGSLLEGQQVTGVYTYENVNGIPEGTSTYKWFRADDNQGTNLTEIAGATLINYTLANTEVGKYVAFEVTPIAASGDSAVGKPVIVYSTGTIGGLGIKDIGSTMVSFYPNPAGNQITFENISQVNKLEIISVVGQQMIVLNGLNTEKLQVNICTLKPGVYFVKFYSSGNASTAKFIKK
jgi:hypothetical protein